jgi:hypothetical protein
MSKVNFFSNVKPSFFESKRKKRYQLTALNFKTTKEVMPYVDKMFDVFNKSYASLSSLVAITIYKRIFQKNTSD